MKQVMIVLMSVACVILLVVTGTASSNNDSQPKRNCYEDMAILAGRPGVPGLHGQVGTPGRDGRDGLEGIQGKRGPRGFDGSPGKQGTPGSPGTPGKYGPSGPEGAKGDAGPTGDKGEAGTSGVSSYSNWKECSWNAFDDDRDTGLIKDCVFQKNHSDSFLRVYWNGDFRIYNCDTCCKRWFFTFNGAECKIPRAIDGILYMWKGKGSKNLHRVRHIEGHCDKIHKGHVRVGFNVGNCASSTPGDAHTGWQSTSRLFIQEVPRPQP